MADYNLGAYMNTLGRADAAGLYFNTTGALQTGRTSAGVSFSQIMGQSAAARSQRPELSSSLDDIFEEAANTYQVDVNLLRAIGKAESGFDPSAVSQAGAMGVMQLMPATASSLGVTRPFDARDNIMGGASYIAGLLKQYNGDAGLALAAYNAGSGNVAKYGGIPPFAETQAYVKKVLEYAGEQEPAGRMVSDAGKVTAEPGTLAQTELADYWAYMVDMMRIQMEMKFAGILDTKDDGDTARQISI